MGIIMPHSLQTQSFSPHRDMAHPSKSQDRILPLSTCRHRQFSCLTDLGLEFFHSFFHSAITEEFLRNSNFDYSKISMIFRLGFRDPILQQFSLRLQRNPFAREDKKPITLECKKLRHLGTIYEFGSQFGRKPQATLPSTRFWAIWRPGNAEIDPIRSETSPFRLERQEASMGRSHSNQGSIVRTLQSSTPNSGTPS